MQLSARNQLKGTVKSVKTDGLMAEVVVDIGGNELVSTITGGPPRSWASRLGMPSPSSSRQARSSLRSERLASRRALAVVLFLLPALAGAVDAPPLATVRVDGALPKSAAFSQKDLEKLGATTLAWTNHGQTHQVTGVRVDKVLVDLGFTPGAMGKDVPIKDKVKGYRQVVVATARDDFQAVFSCAELMEGMGHTVALIVWQVDGKALAPDVGPFRLVVLTDGEGARSIRMLDKLHIADAP